MAKINKHLTKKAREDVMKRETLCTVLYVQTGPDTLETSEQNTQKSKNKSTV